MSDTPASWADYIAEATQRAGGVAKLANLSGLHRGTISEWKAGNNADTATIRSIIAIADAIGDDPRRALLAAGQQPGHLPDQPDPAPATSGLAAELARINERIRAITESGLPLHEQMDAIKTQHELADLAVARYRQRPDAAPDRRSA